MWCCNAWQTGNVTAAKQATATSLLHWCWMSQTRCKSSYQMLRCKHQNVMKLQHLACSQDVLRMHSFNGSELIKDKDASLLKAGFLNEHAVSHHVYSMVQESSDDVKLSPHEEKNMKQLNVDMNPPASVISSYTVVCQGGGVSIKSHHPYTDKTTRPLLIIPETYAQWILWWRFRLPAFILSKVWIFSSLNFCQVTYRQTESDA